MGASPCLSPGGCVSGVYRSARDRDRRSAELLPMSRTAAGAWRGSSLGRLGAASARVSTTRGPGGTSSCLTSHTGRLSSRSTSSSDASLSRSVSTSSTLRISAPQELVDLARRPEVCGIETHHQLITTNDARGGLPTGPTTPQRPHRPATGVSRGSRSASHARRPSPPLAPSKQRRPDESRSIRRWVSTLSLAHVG
jgi:hypothetical protein